jgi:RHS repeat-associated protein
LIGVTLPDGRVIDYIIDAQNHRVGKKVNGALVDTYIYVEGYGVSSVYHADGTGESYEYNQNHMLEGAYLWSAYPQRTTNKVIVDERGSPIRMVQVSLTSGFNQTVVKEQEFDEFGNVISDTNPNALHIGFAGCLYDKDTKLCHFGAREYDPETGRWTSKDPILFGGGDTNLYGYVMSDPVNLIDPSGLKPGDKFSNPADAAKDALDFIWNQSQQNGWEYSGGIYQNKDGTYSATMPTTLKNPFSSQFKWGQAGSYHTHPMVCDDRGISLEPNSFSGPDINLADANHITVFMMGPNRRLNTYRGK